MLSNPGGANSAMIVWPKAQYGAWQRPYMILYALRGSQIHEHTLSLLAEQENSTKIPKYYEI